MFICQLLSKGVVMLKFNQSKNRLAIVGCALVGLTFAGSANAANPESVVVEVEFVAPVTITENNPLQFGLLDVNMINLESIVISPNSAVADPATRVLGGTQAAANLTVSATEAEAITILVDNIASNTGYSLSGFTCNYNSGADTACEGAGYLETSVASATMTVGATMTGNGLAVPGVFNGSFDVTVTYQ
jgi:hypothetical protein